MALTGTRRLRQAARTVAALHGQGGPAGSHRMNHGWREVASKPCLPPHRASRTALSTPGSRQGASASATSTERGSTMWRSLSKRLSVAAAVASTAALAVGAPAARRPPAAALAAVALAAGARAAAETPPFNLEVILRDIGEGKGFGHVTFRQRNDDSK